MHLVSSARIGLSRSPGARRRATFALGVGLTTLAALAGPVAAASGELVITSPSSGAYISDTQPAIAGSVTPLPEEMTPCDIHVDLYRGSEAVGVPVEELETQGCSWLTPPSAALEPGPYTAGATATRFPENEEGVPPETSLPVTFTIDTTAPAVAIGTPAAPATTTTGSISVAGSSGNAPGDSQTVTVQVFSGGAAEGSPLEAIEVPSTAGSWSGLVAGLATGSYSLRAMQSDSAGNVGLSQPIALTVLAPSPPAASFTWFPVSPEVGEPVSLVSSSTDLESPITAFAWALGGTVPFTAGRPTLTTSFTTPGAHLVRLRVTDAAGRSSEAARTIAVRHHRATLMQPFPIVRIAGRQTSRGARLTLLTVTAPVSARVTVKVSGGRGRASSESRVATLRKSNTSNTVVMSFPRFARPLGAGSMLEVRVTKAGEIGKLMRFAPHAGRLPTRQDSCLSVSGKPTKCPSA
ncbi:MAG: hypothetical protein QOK19_2565 [Solirubrobacteraceae bacterium]|nr:hypothetical protein [Solirubrobacteraceae bacterium]